MNLVSHSLLISQHNFFSLFLGGEEGKSLRRFPFNLTHVPPPLHPRVRAPEISYLLANTTPLCLVIIREN